MCLWMVLFQWKMEGMMTNRISRARIPPNTIVFSPLQRK